MSAIRPHQNIPYDILVTTTSTSISLQTKSDRYGQTAQNRTLYCTLTLSTLYGRLSAVYARKFAIDCPHSAPAPLGRARAGSAPGQQRIHWSATIGVHRPLGLGYRLVLVRVRVWVRVWVRVGVRDRVTVRVSACRAAHASVRMACSSCTCTSTTRGALAARSLRREAPRSWLG